MSTPGYCSTAKGIATLYSKALHDKPLAGKTALVTGARHGGIGYETAKVLASLGAALVLVTRSEALCAKTAERLRKEVPGADVSTIAIDLSDLKQVDAAAKQYVKSGKPLHLLINNAGIMACPRKLTKDGYESQFATNHLGHFLLTQELMPTLLASAPSRVINVASVANIMMAPRCAFRWDDLSGEKHYNAWDRYGSSKLANILHAEEIQRRYGAQGVTAVSLHPGTIYGSGLFLNFNLAHLSVFSLFLIPRVYVLVPLEGWKSLGMGAATTLFTACAPTPGSSEAGKLAGRPELLLQPGAYYSNCSPETWRVHRAVGDVEMGRKLWEVSATMVHAALSKQ